MTVLIFYFSINFEHNSEFWCQVVLGLAAYDESQGDPWLWVT